MTDEEPTRAERLAAIRTLQGLRADKQPATREEIARARAILDMAQPGSEEHNMRKQRLAEIEDKRPEFDLSR
jgi:hypothetical protein